MCILKFIHSPVDYLDFFLSYSVPVLHMPVVHLHKSSYSKGWTYWVRGCEKGYLIVTWNSIILITNEMQHLFVFIGYLSILVPLCKILLFLSSLYCAILFLNFLLVCRISLFLIWILHQLNMLQRPGDKYFKGRLD